MLETVGPGPFSHSEEILEATGASRFGILESEFVGEEADELAMYWIVDEGSGETVGYVIIDGLNDSPFLAEFEVCADLVTSE